MANAGARATWMSSTIWRKPWFKAWKRGGKLLWFYLTSCDEGTIAGIFQCDPDVAKMRTGPWGDAAWQRDTAAMYPHVIFYPDNWVFIPGYLEENTHGINEKHAAGIARVVNDAPEQIRADFMARYEKPLGVFAMGIDTPSISPSNPSDETSPPLPSPSHPITAIPRAASVGGKGKLSKEQGMWVVEAVAAFKTAAQRHCNGMAEPEGFNEGVLKSLFKRRILKGDDADDLLGAVKVFARRKTDFDLRTGKDSGFSAKDLASPTTWDSVQKEYQREKANAKG